MWTTKIKNKTNKYARDKNEISGRKKKKKKIQNRK